MSKEISLIIKILIIMGLVFYFAFWKKGTTEEESEMANPASVYCEEHGGTLENKEFDKGTKGFCIFEDSFQCGQWDFFRGDCDKGELKIEILKEGSGKLADSGDTVDVNYIGTLEDGTKFDSSIDKGKPFSFTIGAGKVIRGWDQGILGMKIGEKRKLTIASDLAYGESGMPGTIPPGATLIFEVELLEIK